MADFLGLNIDRSQLIKIILTQTGLIDRILQVTNMQNSNTKYMSAEKYHLSKDTEGDLYCKEGDAGGRDATLFIRKFQARHNIFIKSVHQVKGLEINPNTVLLYLDIFADAYFAVLSTSEDKYDPVSVKSRIMNILNVGGVPIFWNSKLQSEIALSPLDVYYTTLSQGMRGGYQLRLEPQHRAF